MDVGPQVYFNPNPHETYEYRYCADGLRLINRLESVLLRLQNLGASGLESDQSDIRKLVESSVRAALDLDEDPPSLWSCHISRKVMRLAAIVQMDINAKEAFDTAANLRAVALKEFYLPKRTFVKRLARRYLGGKSDPEKAAAWGRTIEGVVNALLQASEPQRERPWRGFYFADALIITSKLNVTQWKDIEKVLLSYLDDWGWTDPYECKRTITYFNLQNTKAHFLRCWDEFEQKHRDARRQQIPVFY